MRYLRVFAALVALALPLSAQQKPAPQAPAPRPRPVPGLYMTFETSMGSIHCRLFPKVAPIAVRTIVGLATGRKSYIDPRTHKKVVGKRFYDGLTFHRVIPNFMIQGGDPLGNGMGSPEGPGFPFKNEVSPSVTFDQPGRLALANAGPDTNGSQFFITEVPVPRLNGGYTIFGQCRNLSVVKAIARVPRDANNRPLRPVVIRHVVVYRISPEPAKAREPARRHQPGPSSS
jgi:peptidyl-prolyl cis-trans isomerase A (cyclophilin A)